MTKPELSNLIEAKRAAIASGERTIREAEQARTLSQSTQKAIVALRLSLTALKNQLSVLEGQR